MADPIGQESVSTSMWKGQRSIFDPEQHVCPSVWIEAIDPQQHLCPSVCVNLSFKTAVRLCQLVAHPFEIDSAVLNCWSERSEFLCAIHPWSPKWKRTWVVESPLQGSPDMCSYRFMCSLINTPRSTVSVLQLFPASWSWYFDVFVHLGLSKVILSGGEV